MSETTTTVHHMTVAKASEKDIRGLNDFMNACEAFLDNRSFRANGIENYDESDTEHKLYQYARKDVFDNTGQDPDDVPEHVAFEFLKLMYNRFANGSGRVIMGCDTLIDNVCDPTVDHLAFHPGFQFNHVENEQ